MLKVENVVDDLPDKFEEGKFYVVTVRNIEGMRKIKEPWMCGYLCPCGCGKYIRLPLLTGAGQGWGYSETDGLPTLTPSIAQTDGCKSHYFIRKGEIQWC
jgi:hypothetical protein